MTEPDVTPRTPWQKVFEYLGLSQADLAASMGYNRSALSRAIGSEYGIISGRNQIKLAQIGSSIGREIDPKLFQPSSEVAVKIALDDHNKKVGNAQRALERARAERAKARLAVVGGHAPAPTEA